MMKKSMLFLFFICLGNFSFSQDVLKERIFEQVLTSEDGHNGHFVWKMKKAGDISVKDEDISTDKISIADWIPAVVPGTVLNSLVYNKVYPEPYFRLNNQLESGLIPDIYRVGQDFYTYWFRTEFDLDKATYSDKKIWLQVDGINYQAEIWLNGDKVGNIAGMFYQDKINITDYAKSGQKNILAVKVYPVDIPGTVKPKGGKSFGATGEFQNGGNGEIGKNVTMLMTVGWDFYYLDGVRDRNTGIWKDISIYTTKEAALAHPFVKSELSKPDYKTSRQTVSVEVSCSNDLKRDVQKAVKIVGEIKEKNIRFEKKVLLSEGEVREVVFTPEEFPQLIIRNPRLWWPVNKGKPDLYNLSFKVIVDGGNKRFDFDAFRHPRNHFRSKYSRQITCFLHQRKTDFY